MLYCYCDARDAYSDIGCMGVIVLDGMGWDVSKMGWVVGQTSD